jgi:hypothetical protein
VKESAGPAEANIVVEGHDEITDEATEGHAGR